MSQTFYRYLFAAEVPLEEIEATVLLALFAAESLHGEAQVRLDAAHQLDKEQRTCTIDATTPVGQDFNRLFTGFLSREFGPDAFRVERAADSAAGRSREVAAAV
ncbi:MAG TPA: hypothetical protein VH643_26465 [Gemmataceae bacterium]|jgi:hypothetical protein